MQTQRVNITLPTELILELRRSIPERSRSKYIAEAVKERLSKRKDLKKNLIKSLKAQEAISREIMEDFKYVDAEAFEKLP